MKKKELQFKKGDWVVHAHHGLGQVADLSTKKLEKDPVDCLEIKTEALTYWLPMNDASIHHIRCLATPRDIKDALQIIAAKPTPLSDDYRIRNAYITAEIARGTLESCAGLIRDLTARNPLKGNDVNENGALARLKRHFIEEMMHTLQLTRPAAEKKLDQALQHITVSHSK
jgi:RNA polymerase-interacting CarD/CdnL/TRCF family regulator